ncbi:MAG: hypothetical protein ACI8V0_003248, partial [Pseudohongiellaceae bacterium]
WVIPDLFPVVQLQTFRGARLSLFKNKIVSF